MRDAGTGNGPGRWLLPLSAAVLALALRLVRLDSVGLRGDEDISTLAARAIAESGLPRLPSGYLYWRAPLYHYLIAPLAAFQVDWLPRLASVLFSSVTVFLIVRLGRRMVGTAPAAVAGFLFAVSVPEIGFSRQIRMYPLFQLLAVGALYGAYRFWLSGRLRDCLRAAGMLLVSAGAHILTGTLGVVFLPLALRVSAASTRILCLALFAGLGAAAYVVGASTIEWVATGDPLVAGVSAEDTTDAGAGARAGLGTLRTRLAHDRIGLSRETFGPWLPLVLAGCALMGAWACGWRRDGRDPFSHVAAMAGCAAVPVAAALNLIGLAYIGILLLVVLRVELLPGRNAARTLIVLAAFAAAATAAWVASGVAAGYGIADTGFALTRWPGRLIRLFAWPPLVGAAAGVWAVRVFVRAWRGRAGEGERFLVVTIVLLTTLRGLLTGRTSYRYIADVWPLWYLLAGCAIAGVVGWVAAGIQRPALRRGLTVGASAVAAAATLLAPGTGVADVRRLLKMKSGDTVRIGPDASTTAVDLRGAVAWVRPRLQPQDRVIATDWLATYCYLGRVDAWVRWKGYEVQSISKEGTLRDVYLGARVLPDLPALLAYLEDGPAWLIAGGLETTAGNEKLPPKVREWLATQEPAVVAADGITKLYRFPKGGAAR
jgi:hypothetical protein